MQCKSRQSESIVGTKKVNSEKSIVHIEANSKDPFLKAVQKNIPGYQ